VGYFNALPVLVRSKGGPDDKRLTKPHDQCNSQSSVGRLHESVSAKSHCPSKQMTVVAVMMAVAVTMARQGHYHTREVTLKRVRALCQSSKASDGG
jgi:hypothetical protein